MADLIDYRKYARKNGGMKYILVVIDAFSRFAYTEPLKFKTAQESADAMDKIFSKFKFPPVMFTSDKGFNSIQNFGKYILREWVSG